MTKSYDELFREACDIFVSANQKLQHCLQLKEMRVINPELTKRFEKSLFNIPLSGTFYDFMQEVRLGNKTPEEIVTKLEAINPL